jgi:hypothetical protein
MPGFTWPPRDTDRNRFLCRLQVVLYALVTVYFGLFALATGALLPWSIFTVALAATIVVAVALVLMRAERRAAGTGAEQVTPPTATDPAATPPPGPPTTRTRGPGGQQARRRTGEQATGQVGEHTGVPGAQRPTVGDPLRR